METSAYGNPEPPWRLKANPDPTKKNWTQTKKYLQTEKQFFIAGTDTIQ